MKTTSILVLVTAVLLSVSPPAFAGAAKIMPLGDSITRGWYGSVDRWGYRKPLYDLLTGGGYNFDFVGIKNDGSFPDPSHEGRDGWQANELLNGRPSAPAEGKLANWLIADQPDVILLHIGTNDVTWGDINFNDVNGILNVIDAYETANNKHITVILALIINRRIDSPAVLRAQTTQFNIDVNNMTMNRIANGDDIIIVNMESALNYNIGVDMADDVHPNDNGYIKMANVWYNALTGIYTVQNITDNKWYLRIQDAINGASSGDEIVVYPGTYTGLGNRDIDFLGKAITVRSTDPDDPDVVSATIIDCQGTEEDPHRGVSFTNGESSNSILTGLKITNGYALLYNGGQAGGGILCWGSSPTISKCIFQGNYAVDGGGGIYCVYSSPTVSNCLFQENSSTGGMGGIGGGICSEHSNPAITNCTFVENVAGAAGGINIYGGQPTITDSTFILNSSGAGGAMFVSDTSGLTLVSGCAFRENSSIDSGGGVYSQRSDLKIINSIFIGNSSEQWSGGGAYDVPTLTNCTFVGNTAATSGGGTANYNTGLTITNCIMWGNSDAGGMDESAQIDFTTGTSINYCCVQGWTGSFGGTENSGTNPQFLADGYHLSMSSPCIDAGNPAGNYTNQTDIDGDPRVIWEGVDIGADEVSTFSWWKFDEGTGAVAYDSSANKDGTIHGAEWTTGRIGGALSFDGNDYVDVGKVIATGAYTKVAWIRLDAGSSYNNIVSSGNIHSHAFYVYNNKLSAWNKPNSPIAQDYEEMSNNIWYFVAVTYDPSVDSGTLTLYRDGLQVGEADEVPPPTAGSNTYIGRYVTGYTIKGDIDDVMIYNRALSAVEVWQLYAKPNLKDWWKMDETSGTIAYDSAGTSNGTVYGGATWTTGQIGGALGFDGADDYVNCGSGPSNYDNVTVSAWMQTTTFGTLVSNRYIAGSYGTWYTLFSNLIEIGDNSQGGYRWLTFNTPTLDGLWHHVVYTKDGTNHVIYVDGAWDQSFTSNADISKSVPLFIGKRWTRSYSVFPLNGKIDDVRIYNRALTEDEVELLYAIGQ